MRILIVIFALMVHCMGEAVYASGDGLNRESILKLFSNSYRQAIQDGVKFDGCKPLTLDGENITISLKDHFGNEIVKEFRFSSEFTDVSLTTYEDKRRSIYFYDLPTYTDEEKLEILNTFPTELAVELLTSTFDSDFYVLLDVNDKIRYIAYSDHRIDLDCSIKN